MNAPGVPFRRDGVRHPDRVPFSSVDEAMHLLDGGPWSCSVHIELRVSGRLEAARLADAIRVTTEIHPMLRARLEPSRFLDRTLQWTVGSTIAEVPLTIVDLRSKLVTDPENAQEMEDTEDDRDALAVVRGEVLSARVPLEAAPGFRVWLLHRDHGDSLLCNVNHAIADGIGALRLVRSIAAASTAADGAKANDPAPAHHPLDARADVGAGRSSTDWVRKAEGMATTVVRSARPAAELAPQGGGGPTSRGTYHVESRIMPAAPLLAARRAAHAIGDPDLDVTVNDILMAALHLTIHEWNRDRGVHAERIAVLMPVNLRPRAWWHDVVANFAGMAAVDTSAANRRDVIDVLRAVRDESARVLRQGGGGLVDIIDGNRWLPLGLKRGLPIAAELLGTRLGGTAVLSNLGAVPHPPDSWAFGNGLAVTELWFSPPAQTPVTVSVGAVTFDGRCGLVIRGCADRLSTAATAAFADRLVTAVTAVTTALTGADPNRVPPGAPSHAAPVRSPA